MPRQSRTHFRMASTSFLSFHSPQVNQRAQGIHPRKRHAFPFQPFFRRGTNQPMLNGSPDRSLIRTVAINRTMQRQFRTDVLTE